MSVARGPACVAVLWLYAAPLAAQPQPQSQLETPEIAIRGIRPARDPNELKVSAEQARQQAGTEDDPVKIIEDVPGLARRPHIGPIPTGESHYVSRRAIAHRRHLER